MDLYVAMGARYFMAMGVHHDNFDCWDSAYQPWNSVRVGPKVDVVGTWEKLARRHGLRFGIGFHLRSPFAHQFMWRVDDATNNYRPDVIYFDEHAGDSQVDLQVNLGLGFLAPPLIANFYNKSLKWSNGNMEAVINLKGVGGRYNSFQRSPELLPYVDRSLVKSIEAVIEPEIMAYSLQTETTIVPWHYQAGQGCMDAERVVELLMENVSRNGTLLLNITQHDRGDLDLEAVRICKDIGAWLKVNGEAVYGSRPFEIFGEGSVRYTRNHGDLYATLLAWTNRPITLKALRTGRATLGMVSKVELLGSNVPMTFVQDEQGLTVTPGRSVRPLPAITNQALASACRVLRIAHDRGWINDDDPGARYPGWIRRCNLGTGDFSNDLTISETPGEVWSCLFTGCGVSIIAPKAAGAGRIEVHMDGEVRATVDLSTAGPRQAEQKVCEVSGLPSGTHTINIVNRGPGPVAVDALVAR
jgi:alpha-L-fucosidase